MPDSSTAKRLALRVAGRCSLADRPPLLIASRRRSSGQPGRLDRPRPRHAADRTGRVLDETFDGGRLDTERLEHLPLVGRRRLHHRARTTSWSGTVPEQVTVRRRRAAADRRAGPDHAARTARRTTSAPAWSPPARRRDDDRGQARLHLRHASRPGSGCRPGRGLWPAIWLLPASQESRPEIDMLEMLGQDPERADHAPAPRGPATPTRRASEYRVPGPDLAEDWHTIRLDWTAGPAGLLRSTASRVWRSPAGRCRTSRCTWC